MISEPRTVAITGIAPISAIGIGREDFRAGLAEGRNGCRPPGNIQGDFPDAPLVAECLDFVVEDYLESEKTYLDRCSEFVLAACALAFEDAGLDWRDLDHPRAGLSLGTAYGCLDSLSNVTARVHAKGMRFASPMIFTHCFPNSQASLASIEYKLAGPVAVFCAGDTSSGAALQYALDLVRWGRAEMMLAGGVDVLSQALLSALSGETRPDCVPGEAACLLVLEAADQAKARGGQILGELLAVGLGGANGEVNAATVDALAEARLEPGDVSTPEPPACGHTFGADLALKLAAGLSGADAGARTEFLVETIDPGGRAAAAVTRRSL